MQPHVFRALSHVAVFATPASRTCLTCDARRALDDGIVEPATLQCGVEPDVSLLAWDVLRVLLLDASPAWLQRAARCSMLSRVAGRRDSVRHSGGGGGGGGDAVTASQSFTATAGATSLFDTQPMPATQAVVPEVDAVVPEEEPVHVGVVEAFFRLMLRQTMRLFRKDGAPLVAGDVQLCCWMRHMCLPAFRHGA